MLCPWDPTTSTTTPGYIYRQVVNLIVAEIESGTLRPGARLAAERDLAGSSAFPT